MALNELEEYVYDSYENYDNKSYESYDDELCDIDKAMQFGKIFNPVFFSIVVVLSVVGNALVVIILLKYENLRSVTNAFILNLAISDLLFTTGLPFWIHYHWNGTWALGETACKLVNFIFYIGYYSSGLLLNFMTIHRYIAVVLPLSDVVSTRGLYCIVAPLIVWFASIAISVPYIIYTQKNPDGFCGYVAESSLGFWGIYQQTALFILTSIVFIFCYSQIIWKLLRPTGKHRKSKTIKVIFTLMVVFFIGWAPYNVVIFLRSNGNGDCNKENPIRYALTITRFCAYSHCCLNPVFYVFVGVKFKNHLIALVEDLGQTKSSKRNSGSVRSRQSRMTVTSITSGEELSL